MNIKKIKKKFDFFCGLKKSLYICNVIKNKQFKNNLKLKSMEITINNVVFGNVNVTMNEYNILNVFNSDNCWICGISLEDIKSFSSNDSIIDSEVNQFILEQISK